MSQNVSAIWNQTMYYVHAGYQDLTESNRYNRLSEETSTAGFYFQHIAETGFLLSGLFLGLSSPYELVTVNGAKDIGQAGDLNYIREVLTAMDKLVGDYVAKATEDELSEIVDTFLGPKTKAEIVTLIMYHSSYHLGQGVQAQKRGRLVQKLEAA